MVNYAVCEYRPISYNKWKKKSSEGIEYRDKLRESFKEFEPVVLRRKEGNLYGIVYYFYTRDAKIDADNISKPVWDCLTGFLFKDDNQVKWRAAGCFDVSREDLTANLSGLPGSVVEKLMEIMDKAIYENEGKDMHVLYIECGTLRKEMFKFNLLKDYGDQQASAL